MVCARGRRVAFSASAGQHRGLMSGMSKPPGGRRVPAVLLAAISAAWIAGPGPTTAEAAAPCPRADSSPQVSLETKPGRVVYDNGKTRRQLQRLQGKSRGASNSKRGWKPIGLTLTELKFRMNISVRTLSRPGNGHCGTVSGVTATLGYERITVYLDKRYKRGSCQYRSVLEHEKEHVAIFRGVLDRYAPKVKRRLVLAASGLKPIAARSPQRAADKLQKALQRQMEPLFEEMNRTLDRENDSIDTAANYRREQARCRKW